MVAPGETALVMVTGNGLKDTRSAIRATRPPIAIRNDLAALSRALRKKRN
jgi:hypothetical protein